MRLRELCAWLLALIGHLALAFDQEPSAEGSGLNQDLENGNQRDESSGRQQQGSWSQWWSYDGISGPDYWNINKQWQLCSLGRKQSPIEVRTERLVYDHLLGPIHLSWQHPVASASMASGSNADAANEEAHAKQPEAAGKLHKQQQEHLRPVKVQLLNSGRGLEIWLEPAAQRGGDVAARWLATQDQLILSRGPLSYAYRLFKLELHTSTSATATPAKDPDGSAHSTPERAPEASAGSSEHQINGRSFSGELQLHFYNRQLAPSAAEALRLADESQRPSLFASISVFLMAGTGSGRDSNPLDFLLDNLSSIQREGDSLELELSTKQIDRLVTSKRHYVTYQGSMNRPPCAESVDWIILNRALKIEARKFNRLLEILSATNQDNVRPIKPLNGRQLRTTINFMEATSSNMSDDDFEEKQRDEKQTLDINHSQMEGKICNPTSNNKLQNCSSQIAPNNNKRKVLTLKQQLNSCNMKPNYSYQLNKMTEKFQLNNGEL